MYLGHRKGTLIAYQVFNILEGLGQLVFMMPGDLTLYFTIESSTSLSRRNVCFSAAYKLL